MGPCCWTRLTQRAFYEHMKRHGTVALVLVVGLSLAGCTNGASSADHGGELGMPMPGVGSSPDGGTDSGGGVVGGVGGDGVVDSDRSILTTGTVSITVEDPAQAAEEAAHTVEAAGGRVDGRTQQAATDSDGGRATLTVRIPSAAFTATLESLKRLGDVDRIDLRSADVTMEGKDLDARIIGLRTSVDRLLDLLQASDSTEDLLKVETVLSDRQTELERLESERAHLADQVALTTVSLELLSVGIAPPDTPDDFWAGLAAGFGGLVDAVVAFTIGLGFALPWIVFLGMLVLVLVLWLLARAALRRRTGVAAASPASGPAAASE